MSLEYVSLDYFLSPIPEEQTTRSGIIPYAVIDNQEYWLLGTLRSGRLSDFGGGCQIPQGETPLDCCLREVDEESNGLLTDAISFAFEESIIYLDEHQQPPEGMHIWRWVNRNKPEMVDYLIFAQVDYDTLANINTLFEANEENTSLDWYSKDDLIDTTPVEDFNTSIQKYMRRFGFKNRKTLGL